MTPDIAEALATIIASIAEGWSVRDSRNQPDGYHVPWPAEARMDAAGTALAAALGCGESWDDIATALRALTRPDVGLPDGWTAANSVIFVGGVSYPAQGPPGNYVVLHVYDSGKTCWGQSGYATPAVYLYLLRAAGVGS